MDWESLYCPNRRCRYYGCPFFQGQLDKNGSSHGQKQARCGACGTHVSIRYGTAYLDLHADPAIFETAVRALAEGHSLRATARIVQIDKDTVCAWLDRAAQHCRLVMLYLWRDLHILECQLDEIWSFIHTKQRHLPFARLYDETYGDAWVWVAFAPVWRLVLALVIGKRTQQSADLLLDRGLQVTAEYIPFFTRDPLPEYRQALLHAYGVWHHPPRNGKRGRYPKPLLLPPPGLLYAQVVKARDHRRIVQVDSKVIFGDPQAIAEKRTSLPTGGTINTSYVERHNLTQRQSNRRLTRRTNGFSKDLSWFERPLWLSLAYYHLVLPHGRLRRPLPEPKPTRGSGSPQRWQPVTPAMAARLTDHVWTTTALLSYRVPPHFLDTLPELERLYPPFEETHHGS
jgi:IS1 family transposase/transposase-like protein